MKLLIVESPAKAKTIEKYFTVYLYHGRVERGNSRPGKSAGRGALCPSHVPGAGFLGRRLDGIPPGKRRACGI